MNVPVGYQATEVGAIPEDWEVASLGSIGKFKNGINKPKEAFGAGHPFVNLMDVFGVGKIETSDHLGLLESNSADRSVYDLKRGDVLFIRSSVKPSGVGLTTVVARDLPDTVYSGFLLRFRDEGQLTTQYKEHCFHDERFRGRIIANSTVSANTNINQSALRAILIGYPPTATEQAAIAEALSDMDEAIAAQAAVITKKRALKVATMQALLSGTRRLPGFSGEWENKSLSTLCSMKSGFGITSKSLAGHGPYECFGGNGFRGFTGRYTHEGLFPLVGPVGALCGNVTLAEGQFFASEHAIVVTPNEKTSARWLAIVLRDLNLNRFSEASAQPVLVVSKLLLMGCFVPPDKDEQEAIALVATDIDADITRSVEKQRKLRQIKVGMMQQLLTGKIRLV